MPRSVLALDIDDVAVRHVDAFCTWSNELFGTRLTPETYTEDWGSLEIWNVDHEEVERRKRLFFTDAVVGAFELVPGAPEGIALLAKQFRVVGVTSRRESLERVTRDLLEQIAPGAIERVVFATYFRGGKKFTRSKVEICREIEAEWLIDDQLKHCLAVLEAGVKAVLFGDYHWNQTAEQLPEGVVRAHTWAETLDVLLDKAACPECGHEVPEVDSRAQKHHMEEHHPEVIAQRLRDAGFRRQDDRWVDMLADDN